MFLLAFANGFIEDFLNIDLDGVTKILSIIINAGSIEFIIDQIFKYFSRNTETTMFENIKNMFHLEKKNEKSRPFYVDYWFYLELL